MIDENNSEETLRKISKISRQIQELSDSCSKRIPGETYEAHNKKRKLRGALDSSVRSLNTAKRVVGLTLEPSNKRTPILTRQSLSRLVSQGKSTEEISAYFDMDVPSILRSMRIFGIQPLTKKS